MNEEDGLCLECVCFGREPYCEEGRDFLRPVRRLKAVVLFYEFSKCSLFTFFVFFSCMNLNVFCLDTRSIEPKPTRKNRGVDYTRPMTCMVGILGRVCFGFGISFTQILFTGERNQRMKE